VNHPMHHDADPRIAFVYQEALRGLVQQQNQVESLNTRAGNLIFAAAFVSSLFGNQALPNGIGGWDAAALGCLFALGVVIVLMIWPYSQYRFRFDPEELLQQYVDSERQATLTQMHRELALRIERDRQGNWRLMQRLRAFLQLALILFLLEILSWLMSLAGY
jgi:hypothetical protein